MAPWTVDTNCVVAAVLDLAPLALLAFHLPREWLDITGAAFGAAAGSQLGAEAPSFTCNAACAADFGVVLAKVAANACVLRWYGVVLPRQAEIARSLAATGRILPSGAIMAAS